MEPQIRESNNWSWDIEDDKVRNELLIGFENIGATFKIFHSRTNPIRKIRITGRKMVFPDPPRIKDISGLDKRKSDYYLINRWSFFDVAVNDILKDSKISFELRILGDLVEREYLYTIVFEIDSNYKVKVLDNFMKTVHV